MPAKKKVEKVSKTSKKAEKTDESKVSELSPADKLRNEGIVVTFALNNKKVHPNVRDITVSNLTLLFHGAPLIEEAELTLNYGNRYGLIGRNGCGKSTFLKTIGARCFPIPDGIDIFHLSEEIEASEMTAKEAVMSVDIERANLENEAELLSDKITTLEEGSEEAEYAMDRLNQVYERLEELDSATAEARAGKILLGLGFTNELQAKKTKDMSGGWRMRVSLARALFIQPTLLLLDEPTNHLDMEAVVWLEDYLSKWNKILFLVSHSQDFLNNVCTHMVHFTKNKLLYFTGNYDAFVKTKSEKEDEKEKIFKKEQDQIKHMKDYIAKFGQGNAKMARQAQSKEKVLEKMLRSGLTDKVEHERPLDFKFPNPMKLAPPVLQCNDISFGYPGREILYANVDFGIDLDSRIALVGPNGAGKSTLLKIMSGDLVPLSGSVRPHPHLRISKFSQHFVDVLDLNLAPLDYFLQIFPDLTREDARKFLGRFGVSGSVQTQIIGNLSDGQKSRVVLAKMARENPHILFLDEPTNHLDMESIDSLAKAINNFEGGMVLVSHDMRLISQVAKEIWLCDNRTVMKFNGEIADFKMRLRNEMQRSNLIEGSTVDSKSSNTSSSMFVSITPVNKLTAATTASNIPVIAPPLPSKVSSSNLEQESLKQARLEMEKLSIEKKSLNSSETDPTAETSEEIDEKAALKAKKKAEREIALAFEKKEEEERQRRREEKLRDIEEAKRLKEESLRLQLEAQAQKAALEAEKKEQERKEAELVALELARLREERRQRKLEKEKEQKRKLELEREALEKRVMADEWTQQQQDEFEEALLTYTPNMEKHERWTKISSAVSGNKSRNQCLLRYKFIKNYVALKYESI